MEIVLAHEGVVGGGIPKVCVVHIGSGHSYGKDTTYYTKIAALRTGFIFNRLLTKRGKTPHKQAYHDSEGHAYRVVEVVAEIAIETPETESTGG